MRIKVAVQTSSLELLSEALKSGCTAVRFGAEFCEQLLPDLSVLGKAYELACEKGKEFTYVTPRLSNAGIKKLGEQFSFLNEKGKVSVVVNDLGALNMLRRYPNLDPHLGRNLFLVPVRSPWAEGYIQKQDPSSEIGRWVRDLFSTTSLNYPATIELYRQYGCQKADVDWVPRTFPSLGSLVESGLSLSAHLHLVPMTFTRKCHMARFLGEENLETCSKPCLTRAFVLRNKVLEEYGVDFFLGGNTVFRLVQPSGRDIVDLEKIGVAELILTMNPITRIYTQGSIDSMISDMMEGAPDHIMRVPLSSRPS